MHLRCTSLPPPPARPPPCHKLHTGSDPKESLRQEPGIHKGLGCRYSPRLACPGCPRATRDRWLLWQLSPIQPPSGAAPHGSDNRHRHPPTRHRRPVVLGHSIYRSALHSGRLASYGDRKSTRLNSSHGYISYAVFCLKKKKKTSKSDTISSTSTPLTDHT